MYFLFGAKFMPPSLTDHPRLRFPFLLVKRRPHHICPARLGPAAPPPTPCLKKQVYGQGDGDGGHGEIIHSELMCPRLARKVVAFWKEHPLAEAAGVSLCGSEGETIVVERLDARTRR